MIAAIYARTSTEKNSTGDNDQLPKTQLVRGHAMRYVLLVLFIALSCPDMSTAQELRALGRESLQGLPGVGVVIGSVMPDAQKDGLSEDSIRTAVEFILRSIGIRVLTLSERLVTPSEPLLHVNVNTQQDESGLYAYNTLVQLQQKVSLVHRPNYKVWASTWETDETGVVGAKGIGEIVTVIESQINVFANDFLAVNPR